MPGTDSRTDPVKTKAVLIDPESMKVVWMNDAAAQDVPNATPDWLAGSPLDSAVPIAEVLGAGPDLIREVATTGATRHLQTSLVSTSRGGMAVTASVYSLPNATVLLLVDSTWQAAPAKSAAERKTPRRR